MNVVLWALPGLLAAAFLAAGFLKTTTPKAQLEPKMPWVADYSDNTVKMIGALDGLAAVGLVVPALTCIAPVLTRIAAAGLVVIMGIVVNLVLLVLAAVVARGRFGPHAL